MSTTGEIPICDSNPQCHAQTKETRNLEHLHQSDGSSPTDRSDSDKDGEGWDGIEYLPQGTAGCVALDRDGAMCVATSTGGLTNKLAGRVGDTPTVGAGFWAEEWEECHAAFSPPSSILPPMIQGVVSSIQRSLLGDCLPFEEEPLGGYHLVNNEKQPAARTKRAIALSGTGNGDSFLRLSARRTAGAIVRFSPPPPPDGLEPIRTLASAVNQIAGQGGELELSAGNRWGKTGEGEAGMIGIEYVVDGTGHAKAEVVFDFNCGGMFRCWIDAEGMERVMVFRDDY